MALALVATATRLLCQHLAHGVVISIACQVIFTGSAWLLKFVVTVLGAFVGVGWIRAFHAIGCVCVVTACQTRLGELIPLGSECSAVFRAVIRFAIWQRGINTVAVYRVHGIRDFHAVVLVATRRRNRHCTGATGCDALLFRGGRRDAVSSRFFAVFKRLRQFVVFQEQGVQQVVMVRRAIGAASVARGVALPRSLRVC